MPIATQVDIHLIEALLTALQSDDAVASAKLMDEITQIRHQELYQRLSNLTENLHQTLDDLSDDSLLMQTKNDLPDASERLQFVLSATEDASNQTLDQAEKILNILDAIPSQALSRDLQMTLQQLHDAANQIITAQSFQDLTGQVLNRVMLIVTSVEQSLISLIEQSGHDYHAIPARETAKHDLQAGIGPNVTTKGKQDSATSQNEVDDLLDSLGI